MAVQCMPSGNFCEFNNIGCSANEFSGYGIFIATVPLSGGIAPVFQFQKAELTLLRHIVCNIMKLIKTQSQIRIITLIPDFCHFYILFIQCFTLTRIISSNIVLQTPD